MTSRMVHARNLATTLITALVASPVFAAGGGNEHGGGHAAAGDHGAPHVANWWGLGKEHANAPALGWMFVTFTTFAVFLLVVLRKPLTGYLESRSDEVKKAIEEAKRAKEQAEARARDAEQKLRALDTEITKMRADFEAQGKSEAERIEKLAQQSAQRIQKDAEDTINAERDRAMQQLRAEASRLALELAEQKIKGALSAADDTRLQQSLVEHLNTSKPAQA
jgi:F-type H+-transporting ATPase subunit b